MSNYSHSYLDSYRACPLRCKLQYEVRLQKREDEGSDHHLRYGHAIHSGLEVWYKGLGLKAAQEAFLLDYPVQLNPDDLAKTRENGIEALRLYAERWQGEDRRWEVLECESRTQAEDGFVTRLDLVVKNRETDEVFGVDHKCVGGRHRYLSYEFWGQFTPNSQINEYVRRLKTTYGPCGGFIINAIGMNFTQRASKSGPAGFHPRFERQTFNPNPDALVEESNNRDYWIGRVEQSKSTGQWGYNTSSCYNCAYKPICSAGYTWERDRELIELQYYQRCDESRCVLELGHDGDHSPWLPIITEQELEVVV